MSTPTTPDVALPAAMVEAAARALYEHDRVPDHEDFDELQDWDQDSYRDAVKAVLTAALGVCKVEERRDYRTFSVRAEDGFGRARSAPAPFRHLVITTPAEPDPSAGQP